MKKTSEELREYVEYYWRWLFDKYGFRIVKIEKHDEHVAAVYEIASEDMLLHFDRERSVTTLTFVSLQDAVKRWYPLEVVWNGLRSGGYRAALGSGETEIFLEAHWDEVAAMFAKNRIQETCKRFDILKAEGQRRCWGVTFNTEPNGALVYLEGNPVIAVDWNGKPYRTPCTILDVPLRVQHLVLKKEGLTDLDCGLVDLRNNNWIEAKWGTDGAPIEIIVKRI